MPGKNGITLENYHLTHIVLIIPLLTQTFTFVTSYEKTLDIEGKYVMGNSNIERFIPHLIIFALD